jgi:hypothetical protein
VGVTCLSQIGLVTGMEHQDCRRPPKLPENPQQFQNLQFNINI